jgi:hypothetical protein
MLTLSGTVFTPIPLAWDQSAAAIECVGRGPANVKDAVATGVVTAVLRPDLTGPGTGEVTLALEKAPWTSRHPIMLAAISGLGGLLVGAVFSKLMRSSSAPTATEY